jgi:diamine N-acetyltransferase
MVTLRSTQITDLDYVLAAEYSQENSSYIGQWSREQHIDLFSQADAAHLIVEAGQTTQPEQLEKVGYVIVQGLTNPDASILLKRLVITHKGQGYGRGAIELIKEMAFNKYHAHRLWLDVKDFNYRAQSLYKSTGFVLEGTFRECLKTESGYESLQIMSILDHEYQSPCISQ